MPLFQGQEVRIQSGFGGAAMHTVERTQSIAWSFDLNRSAVKSLNSFRPETRMPINGYTPVNVNFDYVKSNKFIEDSLGLTNVTGVICGIVNGQNNNGYGVRNIEILQSPLESTTYLGQFNIQSGVLNSYSTNVSVGDFAKTSVSFTALDINFARHSTAKTGVNPSSTVFRHQDVSLTEAFITGFGITGFSPQTIGISLNISRNEINQIGSRFPVDRPLVDASASVQLQGFIEAGNTSLTGLGHYGCGMPTTGDMTITLTSSCGTTNAITYRIVNPYLNSMNVGASVGNMASVDMSFSIPLPINAIESGRENASNLIIS